jgi:hypothetical protein
VRQHLLAANAIPSGASSFGRQESVDAMEFAGLISNAVGMAGVAGKFEQDKVREGAGCFWYVVIA